MAPVVAHPCRSSSDATVATLAATAPRVGTIRGRRTATAASALVNNLAVARILPSIVAVTRGRNLQTDRSTLGVRFADTEIPFQIMGVHGSRGTQSCSEWAFKTAGSSRHGG